MDVRKIIKEEIKKAMLNEGHGFSPVPKTFDHLKWDFTPNQKHYLQRMCEENPNTISESDYKSASKFLGITETNVKSILNTYGSKDSIRASQHGGDSQASVNSRLTFGNKPATAIDIGLSVDDNKLPSFGESTKVMHTNSKGMSHLEMKSKYDSDFKDRTWYREGEGKVHPSKITEKLYENLNKSLMMFLYCEANPKDINLRQDDKIQIDFEPIIEEGKFNQLGSFSYENEKYKFIKGLLNEFNSNFGCSYVIHDHIGMNNCQRMYIENNVTEQVDMSMDSMDMMKKFLLTKVITGHKITQENSHIASLMGLDAGDTTWLYGPVGQAPQSGILTRNR